MGGQRVRRVAISCGFDQLVLYVVQLDEAGVRRVIFEVKRGCRENVGAKFVPRLRLREDGVA